MLHPRNLTGERWVTGGGLATCIFESGAKRCQKTARFGLEAQDAKAPGDRSRGPVYITTEVRKAGG